MVVVHLSITILMTSIESGPYAGTKRVPTSCRVWWPQTRQTLSYRVGPPPAGGSFMRWLGGGVDRL